MAGLTFGDIGRIQWLPTLKLAIARGAASGLIITPVMMAQSGLPAGAALGPALGFYLMWTFGSFIGAPLTALLIKALNAMFAGMGLGIAVLAGNIMLFMLSLMMAIGDPIIYFINKKFPAVFEIADIKLFNMEPAIFILDQTAPA